MRRKIIIFVKIFHSSLFLLNFLANRCNVLNTCSDSFQSAGSLLKRSLSVPTSVAVLINFFGFFPFLYHIFPRHKISKARPELILLPPKTSHTPLTLYFLYALLAAQFFRSIFKRTIPSILLVLIILIIPVSFVLSKCDPHGPSLSTPGISTIRVLPGGIPP